MMTESDVAFRLLRGALDGTAPEVQRMETSRWWSLFRLLQRNHVAALVADTVAALGVPREVLIPWLSEKEKAADWHRHQREVQQDIVGTMARHGIDTLVLKGTHTAQYYPVPELREFGDLDLYFYNKHDEADRVAREVLRVEISNDSHHHTKYNYRGVTIESHYDMLNVHYPPSNRRYEQHLLDDMPMPTFEVLFLLRHMAGHFAASRITLRDLLDWALTCRAMRDKADWQTVEKTITDYGMTDFVAALNTIAAKRLGMQTPLPDSELRTPNIEAVEHDMVYGTVDDHPSNGLGRLGWKIRRWHALAWKRKMVYSDPPAWLLLSGITSHAMKPESILHKQ